MENKVKEVKTVRAKFQCSSVEMYEHSKTAKLFAVCSNDGENKDFTEFTPAGDISIQIDSNVPASGFFEPGKEYYINFIPAN